MAEIADRIIDDATPSNVKDAYALFPKYFNISSTCMLICENDSLRMSCTSHPSKESWNPNYEVSREVFRTLFDINAEIEDLHILFDRTKTDIEVTLLSLATFKRIKENFPEAFALIPAEHLTDSITSLAIPIDALRKTLGL